MNGMSQREGAEAHFLHERSGLEPVLRPPVKHPTALCWLPGKPELVAASRQGVLHHIDPVLGTRTVATGIGEVAAVSVHPTTGDYLIISRGGLWRVVSTDGHTLYTGSHEFLSGISCLWVGNNAAMVGDGVSSRSLVIAQDGKVKSRVRLPKRVAVAASSDGKQLLMARSMPSGLVVVPFGRNAKFPKGEATIHRLQHSNGMFLGFTSTGIAVWSDAKRPPQSMRLPDLTAGAISADGSLIGLGTRGGAVALARIDTLAKRINPDLVRSFQGAVTCIAFADSGRWLATGAEGLRIWSWED
jgi:hypothetical protein